MNEMKACDSVRREVIYSIVTDFGIHIKIGLIKMYLNETYSRERVGRNL
jgi:hypothetical protein